jgi:hypothetical protein
MNHPSLVRTLTASLLVIPLLILPPASAQTKPPVTVASVRGTIATLDGDTLTVRTAAGATSTVHLSAGWGVRAVAPSSMAEIKPGTFIGTATVGPESDMVAREVVVFPDAMKGTGEGSYPWDLTPGSTMTNASVDAEVTQASGEHLSLSYKGGAKKVTVPAGVPIVTFKAGDKAMLVPGAHVFARGPVGADGSIIAGGVAVGENGLIPPM